MIFKIKNKSLTRKEEQLRVRRGTYRFPSQRTHTQAMFYWINSRRALFSSLWRLEDELLTEAGVSSWLLVCVPFFTQEMADFWKPSLTTSDLLGGANGLLGESRLPWQQQSTKQRKTGNNKSLCIFFFLLLLLDLVRCRQVIGFVSELYKNYIQDLSFPAWIGDPVLFFKIIIQDIDIQEPQASSHPCLLTHRAHYEYSIYIAQGSLWI